jgi:hypothetical protein
MFVILKFSFGVFNFMQLAIESALLESVDESKLAFTLNLGVIGF